MDREAIIKNAVRDIYAVLTTLDEQTKIGEKVPTNIIYIALECDMCRFNFTMDSLKTIGCLDVSNGGVSITSHGRKKANEMRELMKPKPHSPENHEHEPA